MKVEKIYSMLDYCEKIKKYLGVYSADSSNLTLYGDSIQKLKDLINNHEITEEVYFIGIVTDIVGDSTRVIRNDKDEIPFLDWIGGENESFTRHHFETTMKQVWEDLFQ